MRRDGHLVELLRLLLDEAAHVGAGLGDSAYLAALEARMLDLIKRCKEEKE